MKIPAKKKNSKYIDTMKKYQIMLTTASILATIATSCSKDEATLEQKHNLKEYTLQVSLIDSQSNSSTKTVRQPDGAVYWSPFDEISLFFCQGEEGGNKFTSTNTEPAQIATFSGTIDVLSGGIDIGQDKAYFWGVYPYSTNISCNGTSVSMVLPSNQQEHSQKDSFHQLAEAKDSECPSTIFAAE